MLSHLARFLRVGEPGWTVRRRMAVATMVFAMAVILLCLSGVVESELAKAAIGDAFLCLGGVPSVYSLAAVADAHSRRLAAPFADAEG